jgi:hypothetical protein
LFWPEPDALLFCGAWAWAQFASATVQARAAAIPHIVFISNFLSLASLRYRRKQVSQTRIQL